ncbi:MAG: prepilin-type N-terminal cleavage/methylation domain-containing protein [Oscillospiraceae bacterium]|nr:prepilin-type N-terminal cleavage/methylation domain-containing protein [Oscillospiraceae bacterium]
MKRNNKKGFTLAELLIVVAIIAVLVAIAIPVFRGQVTKAQEAADKANLRAAYAEAAIDVLEDDDLDTTSYAYGRNTITVSVDASGKVTATDGTYTFDGSTFTNS